MNHNRAGNVASVLVHLALVILLFSITVPQVLERQFRATPIYFPPSPPAQRPKPIHVVKPVSVPKAMPKLAIAPPPPRPLKPEMPMPEAPAVPVPTRPAVANLNLAPAPLAPPPPVVVRKPEVHIGEFESTPAPVARTLETASRLQSSGFDSAPSVAAKNAHGAISAGGAFGDATEIAAARSSRGAVATTQFDAVATKTPSRSASPNTTAGARSPIEITYKPRPLYTDEARRLRIEGEVALQVMFRASSEVCVLRVLRGLGHGLDENAITAASGIHFRPATEGGKPVDDVATVRITFQLAE